MAEDNYSFVRDILNELKNGLGPYIIQEFADHFGNERNVHLERLKKVLSSEKTYRSMEFENDDSALKQIDIAGWLKVMRLRWDTVFKDKLGEEADSEDTNVLNTRAYVRELVDGRNKWGHETDENQISIYDALRISGTAERLLLAVGSAELAETVRLRTEDFGQKKPVTDTETDGEVEEQRVDLSGLNLSGMDLRRRNLHLADLGGADLSGSNLQNEYLAKIDLSYAKVSNALISEGNLCGSNLSHTDMTDTNLERANLTHARMIKAKAINVNLRAAKLSHANLSGADLADADMSTPTWVLDYEDTISDVDGNLFAALRRDYGLSFVDFSDAKLTRAKMQRMFLERNVNLARADMTEANLYGARLVWANLTDATLHDANLSRCWVIHCNFAGAKMKGVDLTGAECYASTFVDAKMSGAKLIKFSYSIADLGEEIDDTWDNVDLSAADLCSAYLFGISLRNAKLKGAIFKSADLSRANLSFAELNETDFTDADLTGANFTGAKFYPLSTILPDGSYWDEDTDMTKFTGPLEDC